MKNFRDVFLALFITVHNVNFANLSKVSKHWNNGSNKKRSRVYEENFKEKSHAW